MASEQARDSDALGNVPVDHERLRYVTKLLGYPPALNTALLGTLLFFWNVIGLGWPSGWWTLLEALAAPVFF